MKRNNAKFVAQGAIIAAIYIVLTLIISSFGLSSGQIQLRLSECLCILPIFTPAAIPGLFLGCMISNIISGGTIIDIIIGSLASLIGAFLTYALRKNPFISTLPPVFTNAFLIPWVLMKSYALNIYSYWPLVFQIAISEFISISIVGYILYLSLKNKKEIFE